MPPKGEQPALLEPAEPACRAGHSSFGADATIRPPMQKLIGIVLVVVGVWVGVSIYTEGIDHAFGGLFSRFSSSPAPERDSTLKRIQKSGSKARDRQLGRIERQLGEGSLGLRDD